MGLGLLLLDFSCGELVFDLFDEDTDGEDASHLGGGSKEVLLEAMGLAYSFMREG